KRNHPMAVGPSTPTNIFVSNTPTLTTSAVGRNAAPRLTTVVSRPSVPAARDTSVTPLVFTSARKRYTNGISWITTADFSSTWYASATLDPASEKAVKAPASTAHVINATCGDPHRG